MRNKHKKQWVDMSRGEKIAGMTMVFILLIMAIAAITGVVEAISKYKPEQKNSQTSDSSKSSPQPTQPPATMAQKAAQPSTTRPQAEPTASLAAQVETAYLKQVGYRSIAELNLDKNDVIGSPENEITSFVNESSGVVKVNVQASLTKAQASQVGMSIMVGASDIKSLKWVDVRGINGTYAEISRQDAGLAD